MFVSDNDPSRAIDIMIDETSNGDLPQQQHHSHQIILGDSSGEEDHELKAPKKRAETWTQDETRSLISLRGEIDNLFSTSNFNKHLWEHISSKMIEKGFDRSPAMCTEKWRNILKKFKKAKYRDDKASSGGSGKMSFYKEIEDILRERNKKLALDESPATPPSSSKVDSFMEFIEEVFEETGTSFTSVEANGRPTLNLDTELDHDSLLLAIASDDPVTANGVPPWIWRDTPENASGDGQPYVGRVITVKFGDYTRRIGIDGTAEAIKEAIRSAFRLRTRRVFWLEDEKQVVRSLDRDMPLGNYTLHVDEGIAIRVCHYDESNLLLVHQEEKIFYTEEDYRDFLARRGWACLQEFGTFLDIDNMDDLQPGFLYQGMR